MDKVQRLQEAAPIDLAQPLHNEDASQGIAAYEADRLAALRSFQILDTEYEKSYDRITALSAKLCETPMAAVSLVDENRQWFKSRVGLPVTQTSRDVSFCSKAIENPQTLMIVEDAAQDARFNTNPLVTGELGVRFYAGIPLVSNSGHPLGALCVIDTKPRQLTEIQKTSLITLGHNIASLLELHKTNIERLRLASELGKTRLEMQAFAYAASHDLKSPLRGIDNLAQWIKEDAQELDDENNERIVLIRGRISRLENLLNSISAYYDGPRKGQLDSRVSLVNLVKSIETAYKFPRGFRINSEAILDTFNVPERTVEHILNHLIDNAIKHHDKGKGTVSISAGLRNNKIEIAVSDDGPGIPEQYHAEVFKMFKTLKPRDEVEGAGMGLSLVEKLVKTSGGDIWIEPNQPRGTTFVFTIPKNSCHSHRRQQHWDCEL